MQTKVLVLLLVAAAQLAVAQEEEVMATTTEVTGVRAAEEGECTGCPTVAIQHYEEKDCTPVMDPKIDPCCPSSYECKSEQEKGVELTSCYYKNVTYAQGDTVPVEGPCRRSCVCQKSVDGLEPAKVVCAVVECPTLFTPLKPGCRGIYAVDKCCEVDKECEPVTAAAAAATAAAAETAAPETDVATDAATDSATDTGTDTAAGTDTTAVEPFSTRERDCFAEGLEYFYGDKMYFQEYPCQYCVCSPDYDGPFGPQCTKIDCGMGYRGRVYLRNGCAPLYVDGTCCSSEYICPNSPAIVNDPTLKAKGDESKSSHCFLGDSVVARGQGLTMQNCHVSCSCITPPELTCVQYSTCEEALSAQRNGYAP